MPTVNSNHPTSELPHPRSTPVRSSHHCLATASALFALTFSLAGCASLPEGSTRDPRDHAERFNRSIYKFNTALDHAILRPVARGYVKVTPHPVRTGVSNFFSNLGYTKTIGNDVFQGHFLDFGSDIARFVVNTTVGIGGLFDPATRTYARADRFLVDGAVFATFEGAEIGTGHTEVNLAGATVVAAFADCHVHITDTGYVIGPRDLSGVRSAGGLCDAVAALPRGERFMLAGNYDESTWDDGQAADASILDAAFPETFAMLVRIDGHSCVVNQRTLAWLDLDPSLSGLERDAGGTPTGRLFLEANWRAQTRFLAAIPLAQRRAAERRATELALSAGALHMHVQLVGFAGSEGYAAEIEALDALPPAKWYPKVCEPDAALAVALGLPYIGGDVFLDGSIGSGTAAMSEPYVCTLAGGASPTHGKLRYTDAQVEDYFTQAERLGISAGVHAIGDAAIEQCIAAWERVLGGKPSPRNRHFIEHFEVATTAQIERAARLGLYLSMQPQFDALWGGERGMYEQRLGRARMELMNALRTALQAGATLCGGDDSPVCNLSPLQGMAAACNHHIAGQRLQPLEALTMYTYDAARLGHVEAQTGLLRAGYAADFVVLDNDPFGDGSFERTRVLQTWRDGVCVYDAGVFA